MIVKNSLYHWKQWINIHANAAGFSIKANKVSNLLEFVNKELENINFNEGFYEADFIVDGNCSYLSDLIEDLDNGKTLYGQGNDEPIIVVENISILKSNISIIGSTKETIRFEFNGITYVKFKANDIIEQIEQASGPLKLTIAGKPNINEWGGRRKPQILIEEIEMKTDSLFEF